MKLFSLILYELAKILKNSQTHANKKEKEVYNITLYLQKS